MLDHADFYFYIFLVFTYTLAYLDICAFYKDVCDIILVVQVFKIERFYQLLDVLKRRHINVLCKAFKNGLRFLKDFFGLIRLWQKGLRCLGVSSSSTSCRWVTNSASYFTRSLCVFVFSIVAGLFFLR